MKYLVLKSHDPYYNLALEEYLFRTSEDEIFLLWQNEGTVVIGRNQNALCEVDVDYLAREKIKLARRITGGGAVYHDLGNLNYTFISRQEGGIDFSEFASPIILALSTLGIRAELSGRNDILVGNRKISGNAQHRECGKVLHHGTLLVNSDLTVLSRVLHPDEEKMRSKAVKSVRSRVMNLSELLGEDFTVSDLKSAILRVIEERFAAEPLKLFGEDEAQISRLAERNASEEWLYPEYGIASAAEQVLSHRFPFGRVELKLALRGELVARVRIFGDFFASADITECERALAGTPLVCLREKLLAIPLSDYIHGMQVDDIEALFD